MIIYFGPKRRGVSELIGALITIAITLIAGLALAGWVYGQLGVSSQQIGNAVAGNVNFLRENEVITAVSFVPPVLPSTVTATVDVWIYNRGQVSLALTSFIVTSVSTPQSVPAPTPSNVQYLSFPNSGPNACSAAVGSPTTSCVLVYDPTGSLACSSTAVTTYAHLIPQTTQPFTASLGQGNLQEYAFTLPCENFATNNVTPPTFTYSFQTIGQFGSTNSFTQNN